MLRLDRPMIIEVSASQAWSTPRWLSRMPAIVWLGDVPVGRAGDRQAVLDRQLADDRLERRGVAAMAVQHEDAGLKPWRIAELTTQRTTASMVA